MNGSSSAYGRAQEPLESTAAWVFDWLVLSLGILVGLIVVARLLVALPAFEELRTAKNFANAMRKRGWWLTLPAAAVMGLAYRGLRSTDDAGLSTLAAAVGLLGLGVGAYGTLVLSAGFAMSARVDAKATTDEGQDNRAWAIAVLTQIRDAHRAGERRGEAARPTTNHADFGNLIAVADRSGNGLAALVAGVVELLLNRSPWLVDVTVLDGVTAAATLRRNGHDLEEGLVQLPFGDPSGDNHRELLIMASSFAAIHVAARYTDIKGFYEVENWRSAALVAVAMATTGDDRRACIQRALEEDPSNLVAEYEEVSDDFDDETDVTTLLNRMDRLEPMIELAAILCGRFPDVGTEFGRWHAVTRERHRARLAAFIHREPSRLLKVLSLTRRERELLWSPDEPEPPLMMLRLMHWYLQSARNWLALELDREGRLPSTDNDPGDSDAEARRQGIAFVMRWMVAELTDQEIIDRVGDPQDMKRMQMIGAIDAAILQPWTQVAFDEAVAEQLEEWLEDSRSSTDSYVQHQLACLFALRFRGSTSDADTKKWSGFLNDSVSYAHFDPYWASWTFSDPELRLAGKDPDLRKLALDNIDNPWQIERFAQIAGRTPVRGLADPAMLTDAVLAELTLDADLMPEVVRSISDGAAILRAARGASRTFGETEVLRAVRHLLDDGGHDLNSLRMDRTHELHHPIVDGVAAAVYWVPSRGERDDAADFVMELIRRISWQAVSKPAT